MRFKPTIHLGAQLLLGALLVACGGDKPNNRAPVAVADASATRVDERQAFPLSAAQSSDPDGDTLLYCWTQTSGTPASLGDTSQAQLSVTMPDVAADETLLFSLIVSDGLLTSSASVDVIVVNLEMPPVAVITASAMSVEERQPFMLTGSASSDPNGDVLTYEWSQTAGQSVTIENLNAVDLSLNMPETSATDTIQFALEVSDGVLTDTATINITLNDIVLTPLNTQFKSTAIGEAGGIVKPRDLQIRNFESYTNSFCDSFPNSRKWVDILGQRANGKGVIGTWTGNGTTITTTTIENSLPSSPGFLANLEYTATSRCANPFGGPGSPTGERNRRENIGTVHYPGDNNVFQRGFDNAIISQTDVCAARGVFDRDPNRLAYLTARASGGLEVRPAPPR